ncbi:DUF2812 domain-containing protein [Clostridium perfringens]|uniref:DUF2812 domain-containing protein n=2 Tax=Clostridium perfringens TaxID=1502 RepID=UPI0024BCD290|nr:DUF2812 domain-containing protein [Clostridium perfringens]
MINKDKKSKYFVFFSYEYNSIREYLEEMALKGWLLKSIMGYSFKFIKTEPKKLKYLVEPIDKNSSSETQNLSSSIPSREYYESAGWKYICEKGNLNIFYSEESSSLLPINRDENEKFKCLFKSSLFEIFPNLLIILILSFNIYNQISNGSIVYLLTSNLSLLSIIALILFTITNVIEIIFFISWSIKAKKAINNGLAIPCSSFKKFKRKNLIKKVINISIISLILIFLFADIIGKNNSLNEPISILLAILMFFVIFLVDIFTRKLIEKNKYSKRTNIIIRSISIVFSFFLVIFVTLNTITGIAGDGFIGNNIHMSETTLPLTLNDFKIYNNESNDIYVNENSSILAKQIYYSNYIDVDNTLNYLFFESDYKFLISAVEKSLIDFKTKLNLEHNPNFVIKEPLIVDGIKIYSLENPINRFTFVSNNKIIDIENSFKDINNEQFIQIILKNIFNKNVTLPNN